MSRSGIRFPQTLLKLSLGVTTNLFAPTPTVLIDIQCTDTTTAQSFEENTHLKKGLSLTKAEEDFVFRAQETKKDFYIYVR